jgi:cation diffusion facilitator family transporter
MTSRDERSLLSREKLAAARLSLAANFFLTVLKLAVGFLTGSVSVLSEAVHSITDLLAAGAVLFTVRLADLPPDESHPYGHGKVESLFTLAEALLLLAAAVAIVYEAVERLLTHARPPRVEWGMAVMAVATGVNLLLVPYLLRVARRTDSLALQADAENHRADITTSLGVLLGLGLVRLTGRGFFDPALAIAVSLMILRTAWRLTWGALPPLMDTQLSPEDVNVVRQVLEAEPGVRGYHKLRTRKSGAVRHVDAHVMLEDDLPLLEAHELTEKVEDRIREELPNAEVILHIEPYHAERQHQAEEHGAGEPQGERSSNSEPPPA